METEFIELKNDDGEYVEELKVFKTIERWIVGLNAIG